MIHVVIVSNFCRDLDGKDRFIYLAEMLQASGKFEVELITSDFTHDTKRPRDLGCLPNHQFKLTLCHEPGYTSNKSLRRLYSHRRWGKNVVKYIKSISRPDLIYCAVPSLTAPHLLSAYCKREGIKFVVDIQDLWPEATFMLFRNKLVHKLSIPMAKYIDGAYRKADAIVAVSESYAKRATNVNHKPIPSMSVYIGNDGNRFFAAKPDIKHDKHIIKIGYIGTLGYSYDIPCVINALALINKSHPHLSLKFLVMGDGPLRSRFEEQSMSLGVDSEFTGMLQYEDMVRRLCACDILVNPIIKGSAASIINKVGDYAFAGLPVVNTQESEEYRRLIETYECGINCQPGDATELANAIIKLVKDPELRTVMGQNARRLGLERFDRRTTYLEIQRLLEQL